MGRAAPRARALTGSGRGCRVRLGFAVELIVGGTATAAAPYLPYTAAATLAGVASGGGMPPIPRGVIALPFPAAGAVLAGVAILLAAVAAATTLRRDIT